MNWALMPIMGCSTIDLQQRYVPGWSSAWPNNSSSGRPSRLRLNRHRHLSASMAGAFNCWLILAARRRRRLHDNGVLKVSDYCAPNFFLLLPRLYQMKTSNVGGMCKFFRLSVATGAILHDRSARLLYVRLMPGQTSRCQHWMLCLARHQKPILHLACAVYAFT